MLKRAEALFEESYIPRKICWDYRNPFHKSEDEESTGEESKGDESEGDQWEGEDSEGDKLESNQKLLVYYFIQDKLRILEHIAGFDKELNKETQKLNRLASFVYPDYRQCEKARNKYNEVENKLNVYIKRKYFCLNNREEIHRREEEFVMHRQDMVVLLKKCNEDE